ncbi:cyclopropane-fatty-acyl-phospholipid synthase family protein [Pelagibius sp.]|uniref:SAM-dependent methyltransferase n=1 Tax=Pelagibius sp. TaxID=1931238 RepID=UPI00261B4DBE|nr:cyclopropane-fatty-acyl-phospholipid synthase family protein [Pelagibius sp.]
MLFQKLLQAVVKTGNLRLIDAAGRTYEYGDGTGPRSTMRLHSRRLEYTLAFNPPLYLGEAYMDGSLTIEEGNLRHFVETMARTYHRIEDNWLVTLGFALGRNTRRLKQYNPIGKAQRNVAHHYDLSGRLYDFFLDADRQYSCAYFRTGRESLEQAQADKKLHLAAKLYLNRPGLKVLDIGSGWGGLGLYLARTGDCEVTGVTLSTEQHKVSRERARKAGLADHVGFHLRDYREDEQRYDRIVSVGMFEHVGKKNYREFFQKVSELLDEDGVFVLHSVGRVNERGPVNPFIRKYIFPGTDVPALSEVLPVIEDCKLVVNDVEVLRLHYAETLKNWAQRFQANREKVRKLYDERFCRMWEAYLLGCEMGFRYQGLMVFQIQITKTITALPQTRDYIYEWEHKRGRETSQAAE